MDWRACSLLTNICVMPWPTERLPNVGKLQTAQMGMVSGFGCPLRRITPTSTNTTTGTRTSLGGSPRKEKPAQAGATTCIASRRKCAGSSVRTFSYLHWLPLCFCLQSFSNPLARSKGACSPFQFCIVQKTLVFNCRILWEACSSLQASSQTA